MQNDKISKSFRAKLLRWYHAHHRKLPWRDKITPYGIWISEIMLQQTQIKTVLPYYHRFLRRFPDLESLARAEETEVLHFWSGLGYYSRARNLHRAARQIIGVHGAFPRDFNAVLALPGVGRYTAGAICSIAFNQPYPIVDGNIRRVLTRLNAIREHVPESYFWSIMSAWVPQKDPASFNQAMMELGALVCLPQNPRCLHCPVRTLCKAKKLGIETKIPAVRRRQASRQVTIAFLVLERNRRILVSTIYKGDFIPGEWGLPWRSLAAKNSAKETALSMCRKILGVAVPLELCGQVRHTISNRQITGFCFFGKVESGIQKLRIEEGYGWASRSSVNKYLVSSLFRKILAKAPGSRLSRSADGLKG